MGNLENKTNENQICIWKTIYSDSNSTTFDKEKDIDNIKYPVGVEVVRVEQGKSCYACDGYGHVPGIEKTCHIYNSLVESYEKNKK